MRIIKSHVEAALLRGIAGAARLDADDREKPIMIVEEVLTEDWASATFLGARITIALRFEGEAAAVEAAFAELGERLQDWEFRLAGQIVADIGLVSGADGTEQLGTIVPKDTVPNLAAVPSLGPSTVSRPFVIEALTIID